jgi:hypothetical protein
MKLLGATLLLLLPAVCVAQCKTVTATLKVKIEASESDKKLLLKKLNDHGCSHALLFEMADEGVEYLISFSNVQKARSTLGLGGGGTAYSSVALTTVYNDKGTLLFQVERGNRLTHPGAVNASAKEVVKRLILVRTRK